MKPFEDVGLKLKPSIQQVHIVINITLFDVLVLLTSINILQERQLEFIIFRNIEFIIQANNHLRNY